jgi:hypothetical protein
MRALASLRNVRKTFLQTLNKTISTEGGKADAFQHLELHSNSTATC